MNPNSTDILASAANNVVTAIKLQDAAIRLQRDESYYQDIIDRRIDSLLGYLRLEQ